MYAPITSPISPAPYTSESEPLLYISQQMELPATHYHNYEQHQPIYNQFPQNPLVSSAYSPHLHMQQSSMSACTTSYLFPPVEAMPLGVSGQPARQQTWIHPSQQPRENESPQEDNTTAPQFCENSGLFSHQRMANLYHEERQRQRISQFNTAQQHQQQPVLQNPSPVLQNPSPVLQNPSQVLQSPSPVLAPVRQPTSTPLQPTPYMYVDMESSEFYFAELLRENKELLGVEPTQQSSMPPLQVGTVQPQPTVPPSEMVESHQTPYSNWDQQLDQSEYPDCGDQFRVFAQHFMENADELDQHKNSLENILLEISCEQQDYESNHPAKQLQQNHQQLSLGQAQMQVPVPVVQQQRQQIHHQQLGSGQAQVQVPVQVPVQAPVQVSVQVPVQVPVQQQLQQIYHQQIRPGQAETKVAVKQQKRKYNKTQKNLGKVQHKGIQKTTID